MQWIKYLKDRIQGKAPKGARRSSEWPRIRKEHLKQYPECFVCGSTKKVECHHLIPFHLAPDLELEPDNLISLCEHGRFKSINCHLLVGHLADYRKINTACEADATVWRFKLRD